MVMGHTQRLIIKTFVAIIYFPSQCTLLYIFVLHRQVVFVISQSLAFAYVLRQYVYPFVLPVCELW